MIPSQTILDVHNLDKKQIIICLGMVFQIYWKMAFNTKYIESYLG